MTLEEIKEKVLTENAKMHDYFAPWHTRAVPYQCRRATRNCMWRMIENQFYENNVIVKGANVLEVACGTGTFVRLFQKLRANTYVGIDVSKKMIEFAQLNSPNADSVSFECISLEEFSKQHAEKFDVIIASSFLHHLVDLETGLIQLKSMLKDGGIFVGLHEVNNNRAFTYLESFDHELSLLFGYQGQIQHSFRHRWQNFRAFILNKQKPNVVQSDSGMADKTDYVDYQLNFVFDLQNNPVAKKYGKVVPYCYFNFSEFRFLRNIKNHNMFVMKK